MSTWAWEGFCRFATFVWSNLFSEACEKEVSCLCCVNAPLRCSQRWLLLQHWTHFMVRFGKKESKMLVLSTWAAIVCSVPWALEDNLVHIRDAQNLSWTDWLSTLGGEAEGSRWHEQAAAGISALCGANLKEVEITPRASGCFSVPALISHMEQRKPTGMVSPGGWSNSTCRLKRAENCWLNRLWIKH